MKRPFLILAIVYAFGCITADQVSLPLWLLFLCTLFGLALAFLVQKLRIYSLLAAVFLVGGTNQSIHTQTVSPDDLRVHFGTSPELVSVRGHLLENPRSKVLDESSPETLSRSLARFRVSSFKKDSGWIAGHGEIQISTIGQLSNDFRSGDPVEISGVLQPPPRPIAEGLFDYRQFLRRQGIYFQLTANDGSDWQLLAEEHQTRGFSDHFIRWAQGALRMGLPEEDESLRLLYTMTLGLKSGLDPETAERFMQAGTMHVFAISGLHIALIAGILLALLRVLRVPRRWCAAVVVPLLWFYTIATGWQPSAIRSSIMMTIVVFGWSLQRPGDLLNSLGAAALIILLFDPQQLFQASFQLSFFVVLSIALLMPPFERFRQRILQHDPLLPAELRPGWQRWLDTPVRFVTVLLVTSLAAWLGSLPLGAYYFHLFTPVSLLANIVVVPLSSLALMCNMGSLLSAFVFPSLAECFNHAAWFFMSAMIWCSERTAELPGAYLNIRSPSLLEFICFYALVFSVFTGWIFKTRFKIWIAAGLALLLVSCSIIIARDFSKWKISILPLGGGDSLVIDAPGWKEDLLVDCGDDRSCDYVVAPYLRAQGHNNLQNLLLTHGDVRHVGGTSNLLSRMPVKSVFTSPVSFRSGPYRSLMKELDQVSGLRQEAAEGDSVAGWKILFPRRGDKFSQADDGPLVLHRTIEGITFLFTSDLARNGQNLLLQRQPALRADVIVSGLPRDGEALQDAFITAVRPRLIIITDAEYPATDRASPALRQRLGQCGIPVLFTRDCGAITLELQGGRIRARAMEAEKASQVLRRFEMNAAPSGY